MKILFVAMANSIHTARWLAQISDQGWDIHLFPSIDAVSIHPDLRNITVYETFYSNQVHHHKSVKTKGFNLYSLTSVNFIKNVWARVFPDYRAEKLAHLIKNIRPDLIHSLGIQNAGYLTIEAKEKLKGDFPPWVVSNWGSDIYLFGRLENHKNQIRNVLRNSDYYSCECIRDLKLAKDFGFTGKVLSVIPNTGGFDFNLLYSLRQGGKISSRRLIMLKGYQGIFGRSLVGLRALKRCAELLRGYEIMIYSAPREVEIAAEIFSKSTGIPVNIIPQGTKHSDILRLHGRARISIGLSISDAISTSFLEAIVMGSFPIQSNTSSCDEWIEDGKTGFIVPPEDPAIIEQAIRVAIQNDDLVNKAAEINYYLAREKLDNQIIKPKVQEIYRTICADS
jgi:glycosyltransferase involved in cell wall biosynthesis